MNINECIKMLRTKKEISINELEKLSTVSAAHISRVENGKRSPSPDILKRLAPHLGVTYEYLMNVAGFISESTSVQTNSDNATEGVLTKLIHDLVDKKIIPDENNISENIYELIKSAIKLEIKLHKDKSNT